MIKPSELTDEEVEDVKVRAENEGDHETARHCRRVLDGTRTQVLYDYSVQYVCDELNARAAKSGGGR